MEEKNQRDIILSCLKSCIKVPQAVEVVSQEEIERTLEEVINFEAKFGTATYTSCQHEKGFFYFNFWRKEMFYCQTGEHRLPGWLIRKLKKESK